MSELWSDLLDCLDLRRSPLTDRPDPDEHATAVTVFEGSNQHLDYHRLFGGQILGQFVRSAELACPSKNIKSLHALFAREGRAEEPVRYEVTCLHEGRSFATLSVVARQSSRVVATTSVSMHAAEDGPDHQTVAEVPPVLTPEYRVNMELIPWEIRSTTDLNSTAAAAPEADLWMRTPRWHRNWPRPSPHTPRI